jgi:hypothetical protein
VLSGETTNINFICWFSTKWASLSSHQM